MDFVMNNKWIILLLLEVVAWSATVFMLYARCRLAPIWFKVGAIVTVCTGVIPQVILGVVNYYLLGELDLFTIVILWIIIYGSTIGKRHVRLLDNWMLNKYGRKDQ